MSIHFWQASFIAFVLATLNVVQIGNIQQVSLKQKIRVQTNKKSPAYLAFQLLQKNEEHTKSVDPVCTDPCESTNLEATAGILTLETEQAYRIGKMVWLSKVSIQREVSDQPDQSSGFTASLSTREALNPQGGSRFQQDGSRFKMGDLQVSQYDQPPQFSKEQFQETAGAQALMSPLHLQGTIELAGGLAVTDRMSIIVGRHEEGQIQDYGTVDIGAGFYEVKVQRRAGMIVAKLVDDKDQLVGEGFYTINAGDVANQKIVIHPVKSLAGIGAYQQPPSNDSLTRGGSKPPVFAQNNLGSGYFQERSPLPNEEKSYTRSTGLGKSDGQTHPNSFALLRSAAKDYFQTNQIVRIKDKIENTLYPQSMIDALRKIVAEQRTSELQFQNLGEMNLDEMTVIYGKVMDEGKPSSGVNVSIERFPDMVPIYFNALMIPDKELKSTSANGYFAFLGPPEGMQSLVARRGTAYISHVNVYAETGAVSQADIQMTLAISETNIVAFDAFTGIVQQMKVSLQSLSQDVETSEENNNVLLPSVNRLSFAHTERTPIYFPSTFVYNDKQALIHLPLLQTEWLNSMNIKVYEKSGQQVSPLFGFIVGFVQDDDFIVEVMGYKSEQKTQVIYFDSTGEILEQQYGIAGGGFLIPNFEDNSAQVKITGRNSRMSFLQMVPVDSQTASVLTFKFKD